MKYKIIIAENISFKQFSGFVDAENRQVAIKKAKEIFIKEYPLYSARFVVYAYSAQEAKQ